MRKANTHTCPEDMLFMDIKKSTCSKSVHPDFKWRPCLLHILDACCVINSGDSQQGLSRLVRTWTAASSLPTKWNDDESLKYRCFLAASVLWLSWQQWPVSASGIPRCSVTNALFFLFCFYLNFDLYLKRKIPTFLTFHSKVHFFENAVVHDCSSLKLKPFTF